MLRAQLARGETLLAANRAAGNLVEHLAQVERQLGEIRDLLGRVEYHGLSAAEQQQRSFENAPILSLSRLKSFEQGHQTRLMLMSSTTVERFEYEHKLLYPTQNGWHDVFGLRRGVGADHWDDFQFLASNEGARSKDGFTIKEVEADGPHNTYQPSPRQVRRSSPSGRARQSKRDR